MRDLISNIKYFSMRPPAQAGSASASAVVDRLGFNSILILLVVGVIAGGSKNVLPKLEGSDDNSEFTEVEDSDLNQPFVGIEADTNQEVQYRGGKRYLRLKTVHSAAADKATFGAVALLSDAQQRPV